VQRRLAGGVRAADDVHLLVDRRRRLGGRAAVEDPRPDQGLDLGHAEPAVGGEDDRTGADLAAVGERQVDPVALAPDRGRVVHAVSFDGAFYDRIGAATEQVPPARMQSFMSRFLTA
jgi:hypothetical protein